MPTTAVPVPPVLTTLVGRLAAAVPRRARTTFTELLIGAATTRGGHVTDAILAAGLSRGWTTYYWFLQRGRWAWLAVWQALLGVLKELPGFKGSSQRLRASIVAPRQRLRRAFSSQGSFAAWR